MDPRMEMIYTDLEDVKEQMHENINKMTIQVVNLEDLDEKAKQIQESSEVFQKDSSRFKKYLYCKDIRLNLMVGLVVTLVIGGLVLIMVLTSIYGK